MELMEHIPVIELQPKKLILNFARPKGSFNVKRTRYLPLPEFLDGNKKSGDDTILYRKLSYRI